MFRLSLLVIAASLALATGIPLGTALAQAVRTAPAPTYADLADLADRARLVAVVEVRDVAPLKPEQAPGLRPGTARAYVKARTQGVLTGEALGESVTYLVDLPLDPKGKLPKLKKSRAIVFAAPVPGRPGELQLVAPDAQIAWSPSIDAQVRAILTELAARGAPPRISGVREATYVPGNLVGEGETQIFLSTQAGDLVSLSVLRRPGQAPTWGVAFGEIVDQAARPPARDTLAWYRLACFLPAALPPSAVIGGDGDAGRRAAEDYRFVRAELGACPRSRRSR